MSYGVGMSKKGQRSVTYYFKGPLRQIIGREKHLQSQKPVQILVLVFN
jgi:hypothetical protein